MKSSPNRLDCPPPRLEARAHLDLEGLVVGHADDAREGPEPIAVRIRRRRRVRRDEIAAGEAAYEDTDPAVSLDFLRAHGIVYAYAGLALFTMAGALLVASSVLADQLAAIVGSMLWPLALDLWFPFRSSAFAKSQGVRARSAT